MNSLLTLFKNSTALARHPHIINPHFTVGSNVATHPSENGWVSISDVDMCNKKIDKDSGLKGYRMQIYDLSLLLYQIGIHLHVSV